MNRTNRDLITFQAEQSLSPVQQRRGLGRLLLSQAGTCVAQSGPSEFCLHAQGRKSFCCRFVQTDRLGQQVELEIDITYLELAKSRLIGHFKLLISPASKFEKLESLIETAFKKIKVAQSDLDLGLCNVEIVRPGSCKCRLIDHLGLAKTVLQSQDECLAILDHRELSLVIDRAEALMGRAEIGFSFTVEITPPVQVSYVVLDLACGILIVIFDEYLASSNSRRYRFVIAAEQSKGIHLTWLGLSGEMQFIDRKKTGFGSVEPFNTFCEFAADKAFDRICPIGISPDFLIAA